VEVEATTLDNMEVATSIDIVVLAITLVETAHVEVEMEPVLLESALAAVGLVTAAPEKSST